MYYTSYFGNLKNIPASLFPISICGKAPDWWNGFEYKRLAPSWSIWSEWKYDHHDDGIYTARFKEERLKLLQPDEVVKKLLGMSMNVPFCLLCYEKPGDFCHRHLVAEWLTAAGYPTEELL